MRGNERRAVKSEWVLVLTLVPVFALAAGQTVTSPSQTPSAQAAAEQSQSQPEKDQPQSDLSDAARRAREERERQRAKRSAGSEAVNQMADELSDASERATPAPVGYRYYNFKQGDYSILVPADAEVEGRDSYGLKLLSSEAMGSRTIVILGDPIPAQGDTPDEIIRNASSQYIPGCNAAAGPGGPCPFHNEVLGSARYFPRDGYVMPVICGYPYIAEDLVPNSNLPIATLVKRYDRERDGFRACDTILPSLRFNDHGSKWHPKTGAGVPKKAVVTNALLNSDSTVDAGGAENDSLGKFARLHKKVSSAEVLTELQHTSPGFSSYAFNYCSKDECFAASLQIPDKAHKDEQFQTNYSGLFEFVVPVGDAVAVIQASKGGPTKPGIISREEFINTKVDWWIENVPAVYFTGAGKAEVFSEALTTLSGMPVRLATFRSPTAFQPVITQLVAYMAPGVFVHIRCSVPEKVYADAQSMCEHVVRSLDVPQSKTEAGDDPPTPDGNDP
jgi:hypothetical protein